MDNISFNKLIDDALNYYDTKTKHYHDYIMIPQDSEINRDNGTIRFPKQDKVYKYEILGLFENETNIWIWAWMIPDFKFNETLLVKKLLNYGLKIGPTQNENLTSDKLYLKTQFLNSRFLLKNDFQLELHLAISLYLIKDNAKFIYPVKVNLNKTKTKYITLYYIII